MVGDPEATANAIRHSPAEPDFEGIRRDTYYFVGAQFLVIGVLYLMPGNMSGWSEEQKDERHLDEWWENVNHPTWDEDDLWLNYLAHPYWGAAYFVRAQERGYGERESFLYSALLSTIYEFGIEAFFEQPSIQDLFVTPIVGSWAGGYFMKWRDQTRSRITRTGATRSRDKALLVATDPLGSLNGWIDRKMGWETDLAVYPFVIQMPEPDSGASLRRLPGPFPADDTVIGLRARLTF